MRVFEGHTDRASSVAWSPDERCALSGSWDKTVRLWDAVTGKVFRVIEYPDDRAPALAFTPDGQDLLVGFTPVPKGLMTMPGPVEYSRLLVAELVDGAFADVSGAIRPDWSMAK